MNSLKQVVAKQAEELAQLRADLATTRSVINNDTELEELARTEALKVLTDAQVNGDSYGVPTIVCIVQNLVDKLTTALKANKELAVSIELITQERDAAQKACAAMRSALEAFHVLIGESSGVYGLHLNGDLAPWGEILVGGRFERIPDIDQALSTSHGKDYVRLNWRPGTELPNKPFVIFERHNGKVEVHEHGIPSDTKRWLYASELEDGK